MENIEIKNLIKTGYELISQLDYFPYDGKKAVTLIDDTNEWADKAINRLKALGEDSDNIKILKIKNPISGIFDFEKLENKKTEKTIKKEINSYLVLILESLIKNKNITSKENTIYYNRESIYINAEKIYSPKSIKGAYPKRMALLTELIKATRPISATELAKKIKYKTLSTIIKEKININDQAKKHLKIKKNLIKNDKRLGYTINKNDFNFIKE